jgi:hypothetical protein
MKCKTPLLQTPLASLSPKGVEQDAERPISMHDAAGNDNGEPCSVKHAANMGRGIWVHGTIKFVNVRKKKQEQTYKKGAPRRGQKMTKTCHAHLKTEPEEDDTAPSASDDELACPERARA